MARLLLINGPNLNLLGTREPGVYGQTSLNDIEAALTATAAELGHELDALLAVGIPFIEVHLSNTFAREDFRHKSFFSDIAAGCLFGLGAYGYELALRAAHRQLQGDGG